MSCTQLFFFILPTHEAQGNLAKAGVADYDWRETILEARPWLRSATSRHSSVAWLGPAFPWSSGHDHPAAGGSRLGWAHPSCQQPPWIPRLLSQSSLSTLVQLVPSKPPSQEGTGSHFSGLRSKCLLPRAGNMDMQGGPTEPHTQGWDLPCRKEPLTCLGQAMRCNGVSPGSAGLETKCETCQTSIFQRFCTGRGCKVLL